MSSKRAIRRRLHNKSCSGKQAHPTQAQAVAHMIHLKCSGGERLKTYLCDFCGHWHVGHRKKH